MKKILFILFTNISCLIGYSQVETDEKKLIQKYDLPANFFNSSFNAKEYIKSHYENLSKSDGKKIIPPENMVTELGSFFMNRKRLNQAYELLKMNIDYYPQSYNLYSHMGDYYKTIGDEERSFVYYARAINVKYKQPLFSSDPSMKIDSAVLSDYQQLAKQTNLGKLNTEYLVSSIAFSLLRSRQTDKAYTLFKMNSENYPNSAAVISDMGDYYSNIKDSLKAFSYWAQSIMLENKLPDSFFKASFDPANYFENYYSNLSKPGSKKVLPPESLLNSLGYVFMMGKLFEKAGPLFKLNIQNHPKSSNAFDSMGDYYEAIGDKIKADEFHKKSQVMVNNNTGVSYDTTYLKVIAPSCQTNCPTILFDEAHNNYHKASGRYKPFANLMTNDGFKIKSSQSPFSKESLASVNVVVIASPGEIKDAEVLVLNDWIRQGGSLLAITDHDNFTIDGLLQSLGVETPYVNVTEDPLNARLLEDGITVNPRHIVFSEQKKLLGNHPIIRGRNNSERVKQVTTFSGRTIIAPPGSSILLLMNESSVEYLSIEPTQRDTKALIPVKSKGTRSFGVAFKFGKGRVVVVSEAAMLTVQGPGGMNTPGSDNRQFALNIMRWLTGYLK